MFCVIQEIKTRKQNKRGDSKELVNYTWQLTYHGEIVTKNAHRYGDEKFERSIKKAYRISIHKSYRENGKVKKKQFVLGTVNYYEFADGWFTYYDYFDAKIHMVAERLHESVDDVYELLQRKIDPLKRCIQEEFSKTEEYKVHQEHKRITTVYAAKKAEFNQKYGLDGSYAHEYDICYDVFGNLTNPEYLKKVQQEYKQRKEYEKKSRSYQEEYFNNYWKRFSGGGSGYSHPVSGNKGENKEVLKQFYRVLSKKFHPDANPDKDTSEEMKILNQLKNEWGV